MTNIFIIIPSFNESKALRNTILPLLKTSMQVLVVDDCSTDDTFTNIADLPIHYIKHPINLGQGAALQTGADYALQNGAEYIIHFDADGQHNYKEIPLLLAPLIENNCDVVLGSRFLREEDINAIPVFRRFILKIAIWVNALFTGLLLTDAHNGFRALNRKAFKSIKLTENRMAHASEILMCIKKEKLSYVEIPVHIIYTDYSKQKGQSSYNSFNILLDLIINKLF